MSIEPYDQSYLASSSEATLTPMTERIIEECPRARILVIGRSGVGKSSLVNAIFKTSLALVDDRKTGESDINKEYTSEHNVRFVLHDSKGYEPGNERNFKVLENFIKARTRPEIPISEQLHAIWLCISVPHAGGRIFERGEDKVFKFERAKVPIIVVFTKFDLLASSARLRESGSFSGDDSIQRLVGKTFEEKCATPFKLLTRDIQAEIPFLPVSIRQLDTLQNLVKVTVQNIQIEAPIALQGSSEDARVEAKDKSLLSRIKRFFFRKNIKHAKPVENQDTCPTSTVDNSQRAGQTEDPSDLAQVALAMAQRISEPEKIAASIWKLQLTGEAKTLIAEAIGCAERYSNMEVFPVHFAFALISAGNGGGATANGDRTTTVPLLDSVISKAGFCRNQLIERLEEMIEELPTSNQSQLEPEPSDAIGRILVNANDSAVKHDSPMDVEHLFFAILRFSDDEVLKIFQQYGVTEAALEAEQRSRRSQEGEGEELRKREEAERLEKEEQSKCKEAERIEGEEQHKLNDEDDYCWSDVNSAQSSTLCFLFLLVAVIAAILAAIPRCN